LTIPKKREGERGERGRGGEREKWRKGEGEREAYQCPMPHKIFDSSYQSIQNPKSKI
jgi:hypothetical protein